MTLGPERIEPLSDSLVRNRKPFPISAATSDLFAVVHSFLLNSLFRLVPHLSIARFPLSLIRACNSGDLRISIHSPICNLILSSSSRFPSFEAPGADCVSGFGDNDVDDFEGCSSCG